MPPTRMAFLSLLKDLQKIKLLMWMLHMPELTNPPKQYQKTPPTSVPTHTLTNRARQRLLPLHSSQALTQQQQTRNTGNWSPCTPMRRPPTAATILRRSTATPWGGGGRWQEMQVRMRKTGIQFPQNLLILFPVMKVKFKE